MEHDGILDIVVGSLHKIIESAVVIKINHIQNFQEKFRVFKAQNRELFRVLRGKIGNFVVLYAASCPSLILVDTFRVHQTRKVDVPDAKSYLPKDGSGFG